MKVSLFQQVPYRHLPHDFETRYESSVTTPYAELVDPEQAHADYRHSLDELLRAARAGFDGVAVTEHGQSSYDMAPNPDLLASVLAYITASEGLETAIYPMGRSLGKSREPVRVAEEYAMLDCLSGGRLVAGFPVGLAYDASINNGVPPAEVRGRFDENLELVRRAWQAPEPFVWNGRFHQYPAVNIWPRPMQQPHPPVWMTGLGNPRTMEFTFDHGLGFNYFSWFGAKVAAPRVFERFWEIADAKGQDRNPYRVGFMQVVGVAETDAQARELYGEHIEYFYQKALGRLPLHRLALPGGIDIRGLEAIFKDPGDFGIYMRLSESTLDDLIDEGCVVLGSPATVRDQLTQIIEQFGVGNLHTMLQIGSMPTELAQHNIDLFASEVLPALRPIWQDAGWQHHWWPERLGGAGAPDEAREKVVA